MNAAVDRAVPDVHRLDEFSFYATLRTLPGVTLVAFTRRACGTCAYMEAVLADRLSGLADQLVWIDAEVATALVRAYAVFHLPGMLLFRDGVFHSELSCALDALALRSGIAAALGEPAREEP